MFAPLAAILVVVAAQPAGEPVGTSPIELPPIELPGLGPARDLPPAAPAWLIEVPAGFTPREDLAIGARDGLKAIPGVLTRAAQAWTDGSGELSVLVYAASVRLPAGSKPKLALMAMLMEHRTSARGQATEQRFQLDELGDHIRSDQGIDDAGARSAIRAYAALDRKSRLHLVAMFCAVPAARAGECDPIVDSFQLGLPVAERTRIEAAATKAASGDSESGGGVGSRSLVFAIVGVVVAGLIGLVRRLRS